LGTKKKKEENSFFLSEIQSAARGNLSVGASPKALFQVHQAWAAKAKRRKTRLSQGKKTASKQAHHHHPRATKTVHPYRP
jgi:hypothetical protein